MKNFSELVDIFINLGLRLIPFLGVVAFLVFVLGVGRFIKSTGSETDMEKKKKLLIWGVVGMFVLVAMWGIIAFLRSEFGFGNDVGVPQINIHAEDVRSTFTPN